MSVPCSVKTWLYAWRERICVPGRASSVRISSARMPPTTKNPSELIR